MVPRTTLAILVYALVVLSAAFGVLMGGYLLLASTEDAAATVMQWIGRVLLMLIALDALLLLGSLGVNSLADRRDG